MPTDHDDSGTDDGATPGPDEAAARAALPADERALLDAFDRLSPQDSVRWNYDDAVRRLTEPPGIPGRSYPWTGLPGDLWERGRSTRASERVLGDVVTVVSQEVTEYTDRAVEESRGLTELALAELRRTTLDAVRFLAARVERLESAADPLGLEAGELELPAPDLSEWTSPVVGWASGRGDLPAVVGELGDDRLVGALAAAGTAVDAVDPRGTVVWSEVPSLAGAGDGRVNVTMAAVVEHLRRLDAASRGCVVLSGCVDRAGLAGKVELVDEAARVVAEGGSVVVLASDQGAWDEGLDPVLRDLLPGRPLHPEAWRVLLARRGLTGAGVRWASTGAVHAVVAEVGP